jgi:5-methylcytosine-specific restriction endonuclease McrA
MMRKNTKTKNTAIKLKPKGGIKAPRKAKSTLLWESEFLPILKSLHGNHAQRIFHRVMKKSSTLRSTLKRRSKEYEVVFKISLPEIRRLLLRAYGSKCKYCRNILDVRNMVCDHMVPLSNGGDSTPENLEMICKRCNTRKGPLTTKEYQGVVLWLSTQEKWVRGYINRKLAGKDMF